MIAELLLPKLSEWEPPRTGRQGWTQPLGESGWVLHLTADRVDSLGALLWEAILTRSPAPSVDNPALRAHADRLARQAVGLLEPLAFIELDEVRGEALLRSGSPSHRNGTLSYYEVVITGGRQITLRRYQNHPDRGRREQVAFTLTHEALARLVENMVRQD